MRSLRWAGLVFVAGVLGWGQAVSTSQIKGTVVDQTGLAIPERKSSSRRPTRAWSAPPPPIRRAPTCYQPSRRAVSTGSDQAGFQSIRSDRNYVAGGHQSDHRSLSRGRPGQQLVEVEANASMVETQSSRRGQVIDSQRIVDLPLIGRDVSDLIGLAGAATVGSDPNQLSSRNYPNIESYSVAGRACHRHHLRAGWVHAQRRVHQRQPPAAVPRRAAGVQSGDRRFAGAVRDAFRRGGQRGDQVRRQ